MGGKLDSTNILNNQAISVISKIGRDHESFLGNTLEDIAKHKAGILRPNVPYIVNPENEPNVRNVIDEYAKEIGAGPRLSGDSFKLREGLFSSEEWGQFANPLRPFQRDNAVMAIVAAKQAAKTLGENMDDEMIADELLKVRCTVVPGRMQRIKVVPVFGSADYMGREILVDGAHNTDAAIALDDFVSKNERRRYIANRQQRQTGWPVTWVLAMTEGKDAEGYLRTILRPGDNVITTTFGPVDGMPWVKPMDPNTLLQIAQSVTSGITGVAMPKPGTTRALYAAKQLAEKGFPIVLTGSLYLVGDFHRAIQGKKRKDFWTHHYTQDERVMHKRIEQEEQNRINRLIRGQSPNIEGEQLSDEPESTDRRKKRLQREIEALDQEMELLEIEEHQISNRGTIDSTKQDQGSEHFRKRSKTWPPPTTVPPTRRLFPGKFKELRERTKQLKTQLVESVAQDSEPTSSESVGEKTGPRISMHFGQGKGYDRREFWRPEFVKKTKWEAK